MASTALDNLFLRFQKEVFRYLDVESVNSIKREVIVLRDSSLLQMNRDYGCRRESDRLVVYDFSEGMLKAVLMREAFNEHLPMSLRGVDEAKDLGWLYAYINLSGGIKKKWYSIWRNVSPVTRLYGIRYDAPVAFSVFHELTEGKFLRDIYGMFKLIDRYGEKSDRYEYFHLLEDYMIEFMYKFNKLEWNVIMYLLKKPMSSVKEIASGVGVKYGKAYRVYRRLLNLKIVYPVLKISLSKLGILPEFLWIDGVMLKDETVAKLLKLPFLFSKMEYFDGHGGVVLTYAIPKSKQNLILLKEGLHEILKKKPYSYLILRPDYAYRGFNFRLFNPEVGNWVLPITSWVKWYTSFFENPSIEVVRYSGNITGMSLTNVPLDKFEQIDIDVADLIWKKVTGVREITKILKKSPNDVVNSIKKLKQLGVIEELLQINFAGLTEHIFLYYSGRSELCHASIAALSDLPKFMAYLYEESPKRCFVFALLSVPKMYATKIMNALHEVFGKFFNEVEAHIGKAYGASYKFPKEYWDPERRTWKPVDLFNWQLKL